MDAANKQRVADRAQVMTRMFSAYVGEAFSMYRPKGMKERCNASHCMMVVPVAADQFERASTYLCDLCNNGGVAYNYSDLCLCTMPAALVEAIYPDHLAPYPIPRTVFCSQAGVLMLKSAFDSAHRSLYQHPSAVARALVGVNSRACSPMRLYTLLKKSGGAIRVDVTALAINSALKLYTPSCAEV